MYPSTVYDWNFYRTRQLCQNAARAFVRSGNAKKLQDVSQRNLFLVNLRLVLPRWIFEEINSDRDKFLTIFSSVESELKESRT